MCSILHTLCADVFVLFFGYLRFSCEMLFVFFIQHTQNTEWEKCFYSFFFVFCFVKFVCVCVSVFVFHYEGKKAVKKVCEK